MGGEPFPLRRPHAAPAPTIIFAPKENKQKKALTALHKQKQHRIREVFH
jgi:hypothetical protein